MRRTILAQNQAQIMDLKPGEISAVIADPNGFFFYKVKGKSAMSVDEAREEIKATLRNQRMQDAMQAVSQSVTMTSTTAIWTRNAGPRAHDAARRDAAPAACQTGPAGPK